MGALLIIMGIYTEAGQYFGRTWSLWLASLSFLASPFWFNPLTFDWNIVTADYMKWFSWMTAKSGGATRSWSVWWNEENGFYKKMPMRSKLWFVIKSTLFLCIAEGVARSSLLEADMTINKPMIPVSFVVAAIVVFFVLWWLLSMVEHLMPYPVRRTIGIVIGIGLMTTITTIFIEDSNCIRYGLAAYYAIGAMCQLGLLAGSKFVKTFYFVHDLVCGHIIFIPLFLLAILQIPHHIQTWLLYQNALSSDVVVSNILRYARKSQESGGTTAPNEDLVEQISELRKLLYKQEQMIESMGGGSSLGLNRSNASTDAITKLIGQQSQEPMQIQPNVYARQTMTGPVGMGGRTYSASTLDVWGDMAMGDDAQSGYQVTPLQVPSHSATGARDFTFTQPTDMPPR